MLTIVTSATMTILLSSAIMMLATLISKKINEDQKKFTVWMWIRSKNSARLPFPSWFFLIAVIFMVFDVEIALLLPMPITMMTSNIKAWMTVSSLLLLILIIGLYHEWNQGSLEWSN